MYQHSLYKLQIEVELSELNLQEDDEYEITYHITNIGSTNFPSGGTFDSRLRYPHWEESFAVLHIWKNMLDKIDVGETLILKPKKIKAVAGPNAIIFYELYPSGPSANVKVFGMNKNELGRGTFIEYYRVKTKEEINSERNLKIATSSVIILIFIQIFDWVVQLRIIEIWGNQDLILSALYLVLFCVILLSQINLRYK